MGKRFEPDTAPTEHLREATMKRFDHATSQKRHCETLRPPSGTILGVTLFCLMVGCATPPSPPPEPSSRSTPVKVVERPEPLPWVDPPPLDWAVWEMPPLPHFDPDFPRLVGEAEGTHAVGDVSDGWLADAVPIPRPHPNMAILHVQRERGLHYTTPQLLNLVEDAAAHVQRSHPNSPIWLGNFSAPGGGDIPYSVSHNSGRDADIGFFVLDDRGKPVEPPDLVPLDRRGEFVDEDGTLYEFDVPRNWAFVEGLIRAGDDEIQYIFISNWLRRMLLRYARDQGVDAEIVSSASRKLLQPAGALPHNDHFHIRIHCDAQDLVFGCEETGSLPPGHYAARRDARSLAARRVRESLASDSADMRAAAIRRLVEMGMKEGIEEALVDPAPVVRAAAARASMAAGIETSVLTTRLVADGDSMVFAELVSVLAERGDDASLSALIAQLGEPRDVSLPATQISDGRLLVVQALAATERPDPVPALIARLDESEAMDVAIVGALRQLTNVRAPERSSESQARVEWWRAWWSANADEPREEWLAAGFREAGYAVDEVEPGSVWGLVRAVRDERPWIAWNAQRSLQRMSTSDAPTLTWSQYDAWYYWRWWFQKKTSLRGVPDVPEELDVELHPYESPEERGEEEPRAERRPAGDVTVAALQ